MLRNETHKLIRTQDDEQLYPLSDPREYEAAPIAPEDRTADEQAQFDALSQEMDRLGSTLVYEGE